MISKVEFLNKYNISQDEFNKSKLNWEDLVDIYNDYIPLKHEYESAAKAIVDILVKVKEVHSVRYRIKNEEHLIEKIIRNKIKDGRRRYNLKNYKNKIDDIIGIRALHLFKSDWEKIDEVIVKNWDTKETPVANIRNGDSAELISKYIEKTYDVKLHPYGYRSVHYILETAPTKKKFVAELQVRTIFEEGWSEIDHLIRYPYDVDNKIFKPYLLMFNGLAGQADEMGTFILYLKEELNRMQEEFELSISKREKTIEELQDKIKSLSISEKERDYISTGINTILTSPLSAINTEFSAYWGNPLAKLLPNTANALGKFSNYNTIAGPSLPLLSTCANCGSNFLNFGDFTICDNCRVTLNTNENNLNIKK